jgi:outer membrane lipoprotein LolB
VNSPVASSRYGGVRLPGAVVFQGALLLAGCAVLRPAAPPVVPAPSAVGASVWEQRVGVLQSLPDWELQGRAAVAYGKQGWQASLTFTQSGDVSDVHLAGPLGIAASELTLMPAGLSVNGAPPTADVVNRLQAKIGFALPLEDLRYWLLGVPAPDAPADVTRNASDRAAQLSQAGWTVVFDRYMPNQGDVLPARLVLSHEDVRIRIVVEQWKLPAEARHD